MPRWPSSVRARLTFWYTTVLGVPLIAFAIASYVGLDRALVSRTDHFLDEALSAFSRELSVEAIEMPTTTLAIGAALHDVQFHEMQIVVFDSLSRFVATGNRPRLTLETSETRQTITPFAIQELSDSLLSHGSSGRSRFTLGRGNNSYLIHVQPDSVRGAPYRVAGAYPLYSIRETLADVRAVYLVAIPLLLVSAAAGGYLMAKRSLSPVSAMGARAAQISATNLHERLPVTNPRDELGGLANVVNGLLARLEQAFVHQRRFMADASHELRTPVAILRTEVEVTLSREHREEHEYRESLGVMRDASQRLTRIVEDLFLLTRADSGHLIVRHEPLYLEEIVHAAARAVRGLADRRGLRLDLLAVAGAPFHGDADLLGRLLLNLLDNAIKFSQRNGVVELALEQRNGAYVITVADDGPGIPAEARERIFDRFFRVDAARSRAQSTGTSGAGLGLSIARWIAEAHGGRLELAVSRPGRTEFRVILPPSGASASSTSDGEQAERV
jgi:two-component system, OmpR family, sensor kinase